VNKTWAAVDVESSNLGAAGRQWTFEYQVDGGGWQTDLTDSGGNQDGVVDTSPDQTLTFPDGTTGQILELRATPAASAVTTTPSEIIQVRVTYQLRPEDLKLIPLQLYIADGQRLLNGARATRGASSDLTQILTWNDQAAEVTVTDIRGTGRDMVFLPGAIRVEEVAKKGRRRSEWLVQTTLAEV